MISYGKIKGGSGKIMEELIYLIKEVRFYIATLIGIFVAQEIVYFVLLKWKIIFRR